MRVYADPPLEEWSPRPGGADEMAVGGRRRLQDQGWSLTGEAWESASPSRSPILATGHQVSLWHPGILAKDLAMDQAARAQSAERLHLFVDHDTNPVASLELPTREGDRLRAERVSLARENLERPACARPAIDLQTARDRLHRRCAQLGGQLLADPEPLLEAMREVADREAERPFPSLADQFAAITGRLLSPWIGPTGALASSAMLHSPDEGFHPLIGWMLHDADRCVRAYNAAAAAYPEANIPPLTMERTRIELPLWSLHTDGPRRRVYADVADTTPILIDEEDEPLPLTEGTGQGEGAWRPAPRAILLSALMRQGFCDWFIHGTGGGAYDRITDAWWWNWREGTLAPTAVVTADLRLDFDAPVADRREFQAARGYRHWAPANLDRLTHGNGPLVRRKQQLVARMDEDANPLRRWLAFREIHRFNEELAHRHPRVLEEADQRLERARLGVVNANVAAKRDWPFPLYPSAKLAALREAFRPQPSPPEVEKARLHAHP